MFRNFSEKKVKRGFKFELKFHFQIFPENNFCSPQKTLFLKKSGTQDSVGSRFRSILLEQSRVPLPRFINQTELSH